MAEATAFRNNATDYPIYGCPYTIVFPFRDADGDLVTGASTPDAEISKNGDTAADCTNESTEIATGTGAYYLSLTSTELTTNCAVVYGKSATAGMKTAIAVLYPQVLASVRSGTSASGGVSTSTIVLDASASAINDYYNGMICKATIDTLIEVRRITDYVGSTQTCTVSPDWNVAPDNNDTFDILLPKDAVLVFPDSVWDVDATAHQTAGTFGKAIGDPLAATNSLIQRTPDAVAGATNGLFIAGTNAATTVTTSLTTTFTGNLTGSVGSVTGAVGSVTGLTNATISDAVWDKDATAHQTQGTFGQAIGDPAADASTIWGLAKTNLDTTVSSRASQASVDAVDNFVDTEISDIQARLPAALVGGRIDASVGAMAANVMTAAAAAADLGTEIAAAVGAKAVAACTSVPAANASIEVTLGYILAELRNLKTLNRTTGVETLKQDDGTTNIGTRTVTDDGTTFTRPELA